MSSRIPFLLCCASLAACGGTPPTDAVSDPIATRAQAVINGETCDEQTNPEAIAILYEMDYTYMGTKYHQVSVECTGTLIAPDVVLTAGHCGSKDAFREMLESSGASVESLEFHVTFHADLEKWANTFTGDLPEGSVGVVGADVHPDFNWNPTNPAGGPQNFNDISVLYLEKPQSVRPSVVITPEERAQLAVDAPITIVGWGQRSATQQIAGLKQCGQTTINELGDTEMQIGGGVETTRNCHGDSGGPAFMDVETSSTIKRRIVGVTSHAYDEGDCTKGGLNTRVDPYYDWLNQTLTAACDNGTRAWCDVKGVIPPTYYDPPKPDQGSAGDTTKSGGCASTPVSLLAMLPLLSAARRRR